MRYGKAGGPSGPASAAAALGLAAALAVVLHGCAGTSGPSQADLALARSISPNFMKAVEGRDPAAAAALYDKDAMVMPPGAPPVRGQQEIRAFWQKMMTTAIRKVTLNPTDLKMAGDIAYEVGEYALEMTLPDGHQGSDTGKYIVLMRRQTDGSWKMTHDIWSSDGASVPAPPVAAVPGTESRP